MARSRSVRQGTDDDVLRATCFFLSAFVPINAAFALSISIQQSTAYALLFWALASLGLLATIIIYVKAVTNKRRKVVTITRIKILDESYIAYITSLLPAFLLPVIDTTSALLLVAIYYVVVVAVVVRTQYYFVNPLLLILGLRLSRATVSDATVELELVSFSRTVDFRKGERVTANIIVHNRVAVLEKLTSG